MKGNNEFRFNGATMMEALQKYINELMGDEAPKVTWVTMENSSNGDWFVVSVTDQEAK